MDPKHALYVLLDSNLPTGGFVASGGLESYAKHGFLSTPTSLYGPSAVGAIQALDLEFAREAAVASASTSTSTSMSTSSKSKFNGDLSAPARPHSAAPLGPSRAGPALMRFASAETDNFAASTGWYLSEAWECVMRALEYSESTDSADTKGGGKDEADITADTVTRLVSLDHTHESTLLSHVARRASRAQGMALLTLYVRGLVPPPGFDETDGVDFMDDDVADANRRRARELAIDGILKTYRRAIRLSAPGHLAVCFGVVAACLGLDLDRTIHLYLFTHMRSTLSAAVRLNVVGPYLSTQLLCHPVRKELVAVEARERRREISEAQVAHQRKQARTKAATEGGKAMTDTQDKQDEWAWADEAERGPATTWPLGEILAARHDLQHSRIFNS